MPHLAAKLRRLNLAVHELSAAQTQQQLLERILDVVERVFERHTAAVLLREGDGDRVRIAAARGYEPDAVARYEGRLGQGVAASVVASGEPRLVPDVASEPDYVPGVRAAVSEMAVPLTVDGEVIGALDVESRDSALDDEDMALLVAFGEQAAWALRHGRALAAADQRARRLELLNHAARALNTIHDPDELLACILELADRALGFHNVAVLVVDDRREHLVVRKALRPVNVDGMHIPLDRGVTGTVFSTGVPEIVPDAMADPRYIPGGLGGAHTEMVAPLRLDGQIIGVLDAEAPGIGAFDALDLEVFSAFAAQVATALRNAQLVRDLEDRARKLRHIMRTGRALNTLLDADDILLEILDAAAEALELDRAAVLLLDDESGELVVHAARGYGEVVGRRVPLGKGITGSVALSGDPVLVHDVAADPRYIPGIDAGAAEMAAPLRVHGELYGVLDTESPEAQAFDEGDLELFAAFADQAAVALHNARLFRRLEKANERLTHSVEELNRLNQELEAYATQIADANASLESQVLQLTTLHRAGQTITASLDLDATLGAILRMSAEIVASSAGAIKLLDAETKEMRVMARDGIFAEDDARFLKYDLPLKIGERTIGVFELVREANKKIGDSEKKLLETLATQAAIAIENARLFENTQRIYYDTLKSLAKALEARDDYTRGHSERVAALALAVAQELGLDQEDCRVIFNSALLHDIGKIGIRDSVLLKPRKLTTEEVQVIRKHPSYSNAILKPLKFLGQVAQVVKHHHERWDGGGYPAGLRSEAIPLPSRIIAVADSYDAMTSTRPYRAPRAHDEAVQEIRAEAGRQLDPAIVEVFLKVIERSGIAAEREATAG